MENILLVTFIVITIAIVGMLVWLLQEHKKLKQEFLALSGNVERNNRDIAGLCSAAVSVDTQMIDNSEQLKGIVEKVTDFEQHEQQATQPYHNAIQRVRDGASAEELMQECGLSREEAVLLIRLHGS